jgi:Hint domain
MTTRTWNADADGLWGDASNWSPNDGFPVAGDTADISTPFTVSASDADDAADIVNVTNADAGLTVDGTLTVSTINLDDGTLRLAGGGEITGNTTINAKNGTFFQSVDGTLDGVTWLGAPLTLEGVTQSSLLTVTTSLNVLNAAGTGPGEIDITGQGASLNIDSTMTLDGTGGNLAINIGAPGSGIEFLSVGSGDVLTLGSLVTVSQTAAASDVMLDDISTNGTIVNNGTMSFIAGAGASAQINPDSFANNGRINVDGGILNGESLDISPASSFSDSGVISLTDFAQVGITTTITPGALSINGTIAVSGSSTIDLNTNASGSGVITLADAGTADINNFSGSIEFLDATGDLALEQPVNYTGQILGLSSLPGTHDVIDLLHTNVTSIVPYAGNSLGGVLTVMDGTDIAATLTLVGNYVDVPFSFASDDNNGFNIFISCFAEGTCLDTSEGPVPVESLRVGDLVLTADGSSRPVCWIGHRRIDLARHPDPAAARPVRVLAHAFGPGLPRRDLWLSPDHAVFVDDVLIPIKCLLNGGTIKQMPAGAITYYHVELAEHDVLLAEGLPAESYLDTGDRANFDNAGALVALHPDFVTVRREANSCAPVIVTGPALRAVRDRLDGHAATGTVLAA